MSDYKSEPKQDSTGVYTVIVCRICGINRYVETRQYQNGFPDTCIKCSKEASYR